MADITLALSESAFRKLFESVRDSIHIVKSGSSSGTFSASYNAGVRLEGGTIDMNNSPDEISISELDVVYDPLSVNLGIDIPEMTIGGFCLFWIPIKGCILRAPKLTLFEANPDINIPLNLSGLIESEISGAFDLKVKYFDNPASQAMNIYQAHEAGKADEWRLHLDPIWLDLDIIDVSDTVGNILNSLVDKLVNTLFGGLPDWVKDVFSWLLGGLVDIVKGILDFADDIDEWISGLLGQSFGLLDFILQQVADYFANKYPVYKIENPYPLFGNPEVLLPIQSLKVDIADTEIVMTANLVPVPTTLIPIEA